MALMQRYLRSQFINSTIGRPTLIVGVCQIAPPTAATLVNQGVTLTAVATGALGNSVTYAVTAGGTAGAEIVTVVGNAISIEIASGVSTITQVRTAINLSAAAALLVVATGTSSSTVTAPVTATPLAGGLFGNVNVSLCGKLVSSMSRTGVGEYTLVLADNYNMMMYAEFQVAIGLELKFQLKSQDVAVAQTIVVSLLSGATPTDLTGAGTFFFKTILNQSSIYK